MEQGLGQTTVREKGDLSSLVPQESFSKLGFVIFPYKCTSDPIYLVSLSGFLVVAAKAPPSYGKRAGMEAVGWGR